MVMKFMVMMRYGLDWIGFWIGLDFGLDWEELGGTGFLVPVPSCFTVYFLLLLLLFSLIL